jgi:hypothetical protein
MTAGPIETHVYARLERGVPGFCFPSPPPCCAGGVFYFARDFLGDAAVPLIFRVGTERSARWGPSCDQCPRTAWRHTEPTNTKESFDDHDQHRDCSHMKWFD